MQIPFRLLDRLQKLGLDESIYDRRVGKCILSREKMDMEKVPWFSDAYYIPENFENKKDFYVFDPVSIVPCIALDLGKNDAILDMCAAPGTKTFILSFLTNNEAEIVSNDIDFRRVRRLKYNVNKFNLSVQVSNVSGRKVQGTYDKILVDAPCSGEGMVNKKKKAFENWSEKRMKLLAKKQKKLIQHAFAILNDGGTLVYSTCTFGPEENEAVVDFLLNKYDNAQLDKIDIKNLNHTKGINEWSGISFSDEVKKCIRIYPQHNNTGGFFVAKIRKKV